MRMKSVGGPWFLALGHLDSLCALVWPLEDVHGALVPTKDETHNFHVHFIDDLQNWEAQKVKWRSPVAAMLDKRSPRALADGPAQLHAHKVGKPCSILIASAERGFAGVPLPALLAYLDGKKVVNDNRASEIHIVELALKTVLPDADEKHILALLALRHVRFNPLSKSGFFTKDHVQEVFDDGDVAEMTRTADTFKCSAEYKDKVRAKTKEYVRAKRAAGPKEKKMSTAQRKLVPVSASREECVRFLPDCRGWAWKGYKDPSNNRWQFFNAMYGTVSRSWPGKGEYESMKEALVEVWKVSIQAEEVDNCPYEWLQAAVAESLAAS